MSNTTVKKSLKDVLDGIKSSEIVSGSLGFDPGVDYEPKSGDEAKWAAKHKREKHADRVGNTDDLYNAANITSNKNSKSNKGHDKGADKNVYENSKCNHTPKGTSCPVHLLLECPKVVSETLTKSTPSSTWVKDFVDSDNPKFSGKSKAERTKMALGAYYAKKKAVTEEHQSVHNAPHHGDSEESVEVLKAELKAIADKVLHMISVMPKEVHVKPWVQSKVSAAKEELSSVHDFMVYGDHGRSEVDDDDDQSKITNTFPVNGPDNVTGISN